jgi:molybdate transport system permease protein
VSGYVDVALRSLGVALAATLLTALPAIWLGFRFAHRRGRGTSVGEAIAMLPLVLPPVVSGFFLLYLLAPAGPLGALIDWAFGVRIPFTLPAAVLAAALVSFPLFLRGARTGFAAVPRELEETATTLGHAPRGVFVQVSLPLARPGIVAGALLAFARALGEFGATLVVAGNIPGRTQTLPLALYEAAQLGDVRTGWVLVGIAAVFALVLVVASSRFERL